MNRRNKYNILWTSLLEISVPVIKFEGKNSFSLRTSRVKNVLQNGITSANREYTLFRAQSQYEGRVSISHFKCE